jgi:hypothetical protein
VSKRKRQNPSRSQKILWLVSMLIVASMVFSLVLVALPSRPAPEPAQPATFTPALIPTASDIPRPTEPPATPTPEATEPIIGPALPADTPEISPTVNISPTVSISPTLIITPAGASLELPSWCTGL